MKYAIVVDIQHIDDGRMGNSMIVGPFESLKDVHDYQDSHSAQAGAYADRILPMVAPFPVSEASEMVLDSDI